MEFECINENRIADKKEKEINVFKLLITNRRTGMLETSTFFEGTFCHVLSHIIEYA